MNDTSKNSPDAMAKAFMDLWQKQLSATFNDPKMTEAMLTNMQNMQDSMSAFSLGMGNNESQSADTTSAGLSEHRDATLERIERRLEAIEQRLAALEK
jgi:hypothetical protein